MPKAEDFSSVEIEEVFTDRIEEQRLFNSLYNSLKNDEYEVINFWGIPGIGKSSLREHLQQEVKRRGGNNHYVCIDFYKNRKEEADYIEELAKKLQIESNFSFPVLSVALSLYIYKLYGERNKTKELEISFESNHPLLSKMIKPAIAILGFAPALSSASKLVEVLIDTFEGELMERITEHKRELLQVENYSIQRFAKKLPYFFTIDYNKNMENESNPTVIFLDTYEAYVSELACTGYEYKNDIWLRNSETGIASRCRNTIWIIFGREKIVWDKLDDYWKNKIYFCELMDFTNDYSREYLNSIGINDMTVVSRIINTSKGVPFHLYLSAEYYFQQIYKGISLDLIDFGNDYEEIFRKYVEGMQNTDKTIIFLMACLGKWKKDVFLSSELSNYVSDTISLNKLHSLSFIRFDGKDTYYLHSEAEDILRKRCPQHIKDIFENYTSRKSEAFELTEDETVEIYINRIRDELEQTYIVTELFHSYEIASEKRDSTVLISSFDNNKSILIKYLTEKEYSNFDAILSVYLQAYKCTTNMVDEEKRVFVEILRLAIKSFIAREWYSNAITMEDELIKLLLDISAVSNEDLIFEKYRKLSLSIMFPHNKMIVTDLKDLYDESQYILGIQNVNTKGIRALYEYMQMTDDYRFEIDIVERFAEEEKRLYGKNSPRGVKADINVAYAYKLHCKYEDSISVGKSLLSRMDCWLDEYDIDYMHAIENLSSAYYCFGIKLKYEQKHYKAKESFQEGLILAKRVYAVYKRKDKDGKRTKKDEEDFLGYITRVIQGMALIQDYSGGLKLCEEALSNSYFAKSDYDTKHIIYDAMACIKMNEREWGKAAYYVRKLYEVICIEKGPKSLEASMIHKRYCELLSLEKKIRK